MLKNHTFWYPIWAMLLISLITRAPTAQANVAEIQLKNYSVQQGLSQGTVTDIIEDDNGFMWFATMIGLNRFDGKNFKQYYPDSNNDESLPQEYVRKLFIDSDKQLWVSTLGGISRYIPEKDSFVSYTTQNSQLQSNEIWAIAETEQGKLIIASQNKLYQYDKQRDNFFPLTFKGARLDDKVRMIFPEQDRIWFGAEKPGIFMLDVSSNTLYSLRDNNPWNLSIPANALFDLKKINGQYWLATDMGVYIVSEQNTIVKHLTVDSIPSITNNTVRTIVQVDNENVWLGTNDGLSVYNQIDDTVFSINQQNYMHVGLNSRYIIKIFKDSNEALWLGTFSSGLFQYHPQFSSIKHFRSIYGPNFSGTDNTVWSMNESADDNIWISTQSGGQSLFNLQTGEFKRYLDNANFNVWDSEVDENQRLWLATDTGVQVFEMKQDKLIKLKNLIPSEFMVGMVNLGGRIWAWSNTLKLYSFDTQSLTATPFVNNFKNINSIIPIFSDSNGYLWLKTNPGLAILDQQSGTLRQLQLRFDLDEEQPVPFNVHETDDAFWVSTAKRGLLKLDKQTYQVKQSINPRGKDARGMVINSVLFGDNKDSVWQSSQSEIWQISLETGELLQSISREMLDFNDLNEGAALVTSKNQVLFGGSQGFHIFDPAKLVKILSNQTNSAYSDSNEQVPPTITQLRILNRPVGLNTPNTPLTRPIYLTKHIQLANNASPFSLEFGQLNPLFEKNYTYRYRLLGLSDEWIYTDSSNRVATYTNIIFGEKTFEVQSKNGISPWSESTRLTIKIAPPFYLHNSALVVYSMLILLFCAYVFRQMKRKAAIQTAIKESEERLKLTLWSSGDELWDWDVYRGQVYRANTWGTLDFPQDNIRANSSYQANIHQNDIARVQEALKKHIDAESDYFQVTYRARTFKGEWIWVLDRGMVVKRDNNNLPLRMTGTLKNISHLKQAEEQLKLYKRSIETISDGVFIADTTFRFISVNQSYCDCTGETREQGLASYLKFNQYPEAFTEEVKKSLRQKGNWNGEVESRRVNGDRYEMELNIDAVQGEDGKVSHYVGVFSDITSRKSTEQELLKLANTDPLTEMPNRSFFQASHNNLVRKDVPHALLCLDMDNFKKINDSLGHQTGDILIKQIGKRLQKLAGNHSTCYRLGGDEFSILIDNTEEMTRINHYAQKILDQMVYPFLINKQEFVLGASVGIAFYPEDGNNPQELLKNADTAMYFAKNAGGNKYQFFSGEMNQNAVRQLQIENLIRYGLKEDLFTVFYQPKVDIASGKLVSMEALVRFEHPEKGIVSPAQFIPLAEETGQIIEIGEQVLRKACEDTKRWVAQGLFTGRVAVNISARQFELPDLDDRIIRILQKADLSPLHLECEITEGTLMQHPEQALRMMERLRERGIHLALDDFGTGYSSLAYLKRFPLNTLKIDKAFIDDIATSSVDKHMTAAIINIAHNLGLKVVAEGVEQEDQLAILKRYDCEMLQGYLYSKPLSSARFERLLQENLQINQLIGQK